MHLIRSHSPVDTPVNTNGIVVVDALRTFEQLERILVWKSSPIFFRATNKTHLIDGLTIPVQFLYPVLLSDSIVVLDLIDGEEVSAYLPIDAIDNETQVELIT